MAVCIHTGKTQHKAPQRVTHICSQHTAQQAISVQVLFYQTREVHTFVGTRCRETWPEPDSLLATALSLMPCQAPSQVLLPHVMSLTTVAASRHVPHRCCCLTSCPSKVSLPHVMPLTAVVVPDFSFARRSTSYDITWHIAHRYLSQVHTCHPHSTPVLVDCLHRYRYSSLMPC